MLLAGSIATTAIPLSASAAFDGNISINDDGGGTVYPSNITYDGNKYDFTSGSLDAVSSKNTENNLWAVFLHWSNTSFECGDIITAVRGNELAKTLYDYREDNGNTYSNAQMKYTHTIAFTTKDLSGTNPVNNSDLKIEPVTTFPYDINDVLGEITVDPLKEITSWTAWYNRDSGNIYDDYNYAGTGNCVRINDTPKLISEKISADIVSAVYKNCSNEEYYAFNYGKTIIQLNTEYKTFEIPVYDGWGEATNQKISVTQTNTDSALKDLNSAALKGKYVLVYDETQYDNDSNYITNKDELWSVIEDVAAAKGTFDVSKAKLVRYVKYDAVIGNFTSVDLLNEVADNQDINYLNERKDSGSIWKISWSEIGPNGYNIYPNKLVYGNSFDAEIKELLNDHDCDTVTLRNKTELHITATDPSTQVNQYGGFKLESTEDVKQYITMDTDKQYPVKVSDLAAKLTAEISPTAGMKYNKDEWELWPCNTNCGCITMDRKATVDNPAADIGITHYELALEQYRNDLLVYFKQVAIAPAVTVTAPVVGANPATTATVPANDGYSVVAGSVKWLDGNTVLTTGETFARGKSYTVEVTLQADNNLSFTDSTPVTINGYSVTRKTFSADKKQMTVYYEFPETERLSIGSADITVIAPAIGANPVNNANIPTNAYYTVQSVSWSDSNGELTTGAKFEYEKPYTVKVTLTAKDGYKFTDATTAKINGNTATATLNDGKLTVSYTFAAIPLTEITSAAITVTAPDGGASPVRTAAVSDNTKYEVTGVNWFDGNNDLFTDTFEAGNQYKVTVTLKANDGYKFTNTTTAKINGNNATKTPNDDGTMTVSYTFTATNWSNEIRNNDNPVIDIPADITTIPANILQVIKDSGKKVTIKYPNSSQNSDYKWVIDGSTFTSDPAGGVDLTLNIVPQEQWATIINNVTGAISKKQISIEYDGALGFTAYLQIELTDIMGGVDANGSYYANLYLVNDTNNSLDWKACSNMTYTNDDRKWSAELEFNHCSDWLITIDARNMNPALNNNNNNGGSTSSGSNTSSEPLPSIDGIPMTWSQIKNYLTNQLAVGDKVTIEMNGITTVPSSVIKVISEREIKTTFYVDSVRSWVVDGADIEEAEAADLTITQTTTTKPDGLRGIEGTQFSINGTNIPSGIQISFKTEHAGKFANLYRVVDGKLVFVSCGKIAANGKAVMSNVSEKGDYIAMICEYSDLMGDVNNDGIVNPKDSTSSLSHFLEIEKCKNQLVADMNRDNFINPKDSYLILQRYLGIA